MIHGPAFQNWAVVKLIRKWYYQIPRQRLAPEIER